MRYASPIPPDKKNEEAEKMTSSRGQTGQGRKAGKSGLSTLVPCPGIQ